MFLHHKAWHPHGYGASTRLIPPNEPASLSPNNLSNIPGTYALLLVDFPGALPGSVGGEEVQELLLDKEANLEGKKGIWGITPELYIRK